MTRSLVRGLCAVLLGTALLLPGVSAANPPGEFPPGAFHKVAAEIGLNDAQMRQVQDIIYQHEASLIDIDARSRKAEMELKHQLMQPTLDEKAVFKALDALNAADAEKKRNRTDLAISLRKVLSFDQWVALARLREGRRGPDDMEPPEPPTPPVPPQPPSR